ncbi:MAG TPA: hypothetical protein VF990_09965 [Candidatus Dormibacteraeota bacterium]
MADYRVGVAVSPKVERRVVWVEANRTDLRPRRAGGAGDDLVRLVLSFQARNEADAVEQAMAVLDQAARMTADGLSGSSLGVVGAQAWIATETPPPVYR